MKKLYNIYFIVLALFFAACTENPLEDVEGTDWQKERNVVSILVEGQIGTAIIERNFDDAKIKIYAKTENIADLTKVEIKNIEFSYGASSANEKGTTLDLSSGITKISVASGAGESLDWEISLLPFKSDLEGTWYIGDVRMYCDMFTWESWGWEKNESMFGYLAELNPELDNKITFSVEGADAKGNPFGKYEHHAGDDGAFGSYTDASKGWDFNSRFRKIPSGNGTWLRDFERNKVIITDANKVEHELDLELLTETNEVNLKTAIPYLADNFSWTDTDWSYEELAHMSKVTWYTLTKERIIQTGNSITGLTVADQVGDTQIDNDTKEITVKIADNGANISTIELTSLNVSYAATTDSSVGSTLDFSTANTTTINVTSETGESATWTINLQIDIDLSDVSIAGTWTVGGISVYCDMFTWETWGWDKTELLNNYLPSASKELDNTISFIVDGKNGDNPYGTYENNSGADGEHGNFISDDTSWPETEFNSRFRKVPTGTGTWELVGDTVTITDSTGAEFVLTLEVNSETEIVLAAEVEYLSELYNWTDTNYSYEETAHMSNKMWYNLSK
ncbi:hypothetical protein H0I25_19205 [Cellulophaga sp. HaHa_2_95]|uniref:hypothetical protein n=1 Tax=Cellulophaga sp. HaHa_2_95 TaxID=2745558 RepID=UPI001C4E6E25|nr:hypothetical protein [Cellulophaga sp. HaHa_2_95]QXP56151.1 hypothetical protein H0I25_19205 [Cellulophaga sp. HaHa_2_95]